MSAAPAYDSNDLTAALAAAWDRAQTVVLVGAPGIGKAQRLRDFAASKGPVLNVSGLPADRSVPYATQRRALIAVLEERPELVQEPWERHELARILPALFEAPAWQEPIRDGVSELRLQDAASAVLARALEHNVAVVNADLQFWDAASFALTRHFLSQFAHARVHALASFTPSAGSSARQRELLALADSGLAEIVTLQPAEDARVWRLDPGTSLPAAGERRAAIGNPGRLWALWRAAPAHRPGSRAANLLESWLEDLSETAVALLRVQALTGEAEALDLAERALELPTEEVRAAQRELDRHGLLTRGEPVHHLIARAALRQAPAEALRRWHARLAVLREEEGAHPATVARHYLDAWRPEDAFPHLLRAGDAAGRLFAQEEARGWYLRALWAASDPGKRAQALLALHDATTEHDPLAAAVEQELEELCATLQEPDLTFDCQIRRARRQARAGLLEPASEAASVALDLALTRRVGDADEARLVLAEVALRARRFDESRDLLREVMTSRYLPRRLEATRRLGWLEETSGNLPEARARYREALALAQALGDRPSVARLLTRAGACEERLGAYDGSVATFMEAAEVAEEIGDRQVQGIALADAAISYVDVGDLGVAYRTAGRAMQVTEPLGLDRSSALAHFVQGYVLRRLGRPMEARADLIEALRLRQVGGDDRGALVARFNLAGLELEEAQASRRVPDPSRAEAIISELLRHNLHEFVAWCLVELAFLTPDAEAADDYLQRSAALAGGQRLALASDAARLRQALLTGDDGAVHACRKVLAARVTGPLWIESSLAYLLLARAADSHEGREGLRERALKRIREEVEPLGEEAVHSRLRYLESRVPPVGLDD